MKKGFTLIELLAVIVILAIIALIATPIVLSIISDSKESSGLRSAEMYLDAVEQAVSIEKMNNTNFNPNSCDITKEGNLYCEGYEDKIEVEVKGEKPINGNITFEEGKITNIRLEYKNDKVIIKDEDGNLVYGGEGEGAGSGSGESGSEDEDTISATQWQNRKWVAFGTSITSTNNTDGVNGSATGKYAPVLTNMSGLDFNDRAVSGGRISGHIVYYTNYYASDMKRSDLITIEGSVNDFVGNVPLGAVGDTTPYYTPLHTDIDNYILSIGGSDSGTFAGSCYHMFKNVKENAPNAVIVYLTENTGKYVPDTGADLSRDRLNDLGLKQQDYIDMAVAVAENMGITVIDAGGKSQINEDHPDYLIDHIHHTELGGQKYAEAVWSELKYISPLTEPLEDVNKDNYFDKNAPDIETGGIYLGGDGSWYANASYFTTGYIRVRCDATLDIYGVDSAIHWNYYDIDTKERICGSNGGPVNGVIGTAKFDNVKPEYSKQYVYVRFGFPRSQMDEIIIKGKL